MDFDFALILVVLTFVSGLVWFFDKISLQPKRKERLASAQAQAEGELPEAVVAEINRESSWVDTGRSMFPVLLVVLILRSFLVEPFQIPSGSMKPTLQVGDFILVNKFHYGLRLPVLNSKIISMNTPERGDVIVFKYPKQPAINYIKRVVGLPGDEVLYHNKELYVNGELQQGVFLRQYPMPLDDQPYASLWKQQLGEITHEIHKDANRPSISGKWVVPDGHYFVMGDNRDNSNDSRRWGYVKDDLVVGKAFAVWMHWPTFLSWPSFGDVRVIE